MTADDTIARPPPLRLSELNKALEAGVRAGMSLVKNLGSGRRDARDATTLRVLGIVMDMQRQGVCIDSLNEEWGWGRVIQYAHDNRVPEDIIVQCIPDCKGHLSGRGLARVFGALELSRTRDGDGPGRSFDSSTSASDVSSSSSTDEPTVP